MKMATEKYTPTHKRLLAVLSDGMPHTKEELWKCIDDELSDLETNLPNHITNLRRNLPSGQDILSRKGPDGVWRYRHVRIVNITGE